MKKSLFFYEFFMILIEPYIEYIIAGYMQFGYEFKNEEPPTPVTTTSIVSS